MKEFSERNSILNHFHVKRIFRCVQNERMFHFHVFQMQERKTIHARTSENNSTLEQIQKKKWRE